MDSNEGLTNEPDITGISLSTIFGTKTSQSICVDISADVNLTMKNHSKR